MSYKIEVVAGQLDGAERDITLDSAGGVLENNTKSVIIGEMYGGLPVPIKNGYNFLGGFNEKDEVISEDSILDSFTKKLTAKWGVNQYTVTLNPNGGTINLNYKQINFNDTYGTLDYVMGYNTKATTIGENSNITHLYPAFFTNTRWNKYYDSYNSTSDISYDSRILGDATGEMGPFENIKDPDNNMRYWTSWYGDYAYFVIPAYPWIGRGGG